MLAVHVHGEAGAVKAAGRGAAVHITRAQVLLGGGRDVAVEEEDSVRSRKSLRM